ncbi:DNA ligase D [Undibacterium sp. Ji42W]|uniref:DNA ligase D n=1 Tax=Undibacterium sp. Ji42W TaxID=3413039 RepID=UPI003BF192B9
MAKPDALQKYKSKRDFSITSEPAEGGTPNEKARAFVIQKHWASSLHYDFRIELDSTMKSWAVPRGPSFDTRDKRMAVHVEDHPISYNSFEGTIPAKQYGAGKVIIWDKGYWKPLGDARQGYENGNLKFELFGHKLRGKWALIKMRNAKGKQEAWLLIKEKDAFARPASEFSVVDEQADSVKALAMPVMESDESNAEAVETGTTKEASNASGPPALAKAAKLPTELKPQLATLVNSAPASVDDWLFEIKFDGYRLLSRVENGKIQLFTRNQNDWTKKLPRLHEELLGMDLPNGWYDGEIVVLNDDGKPDFGALQLAFDDNNTRDINYFIFDLPYCAGQDLREVPLWERRQVLERIMQRQASDLVRFSGIFDHDPGEIVTAACQMGLEGVIGKLKSSAYVSRRSNDWIKLKCAQRQEFVIGGFTEPQGSRIGIGSLLLGVYDNDGKLQFAGNVGTGFNDKNLKSLRTQLNGLVSAERPFAGDTGIDSKSHWVIPELVAEVSFGEWTSAGHIRHSVFQGLRTDKPANSIVREQAVNPAYAALADKKRPGKWQQIRNVAKPEKGATAKRGIKKDVHESLPADFKITHPERIMDEESGTTKLQLVRYYALIAPLMMEHLKDRPLALVRAPAGVSGELFFQKHADTRTLPGVSQTRDNLLPGHPGLLVIKKPEGLIYSAQWNTVEVHTMNATAASFDKPDRMMFDLDPGEGVDWKSVQEAASLMQAMLAELELQPFLKTSGGKGLHVVVPIKKRYDWNTVKDFSEAIVTHMANTIPERFVSKSGPKNRVGKIFIDYLRNGLGATTACAWSARARPGMGISIPVNWEELDKLRGGNHWTVHTVDERLDVGNGPWKDYADSTRSLTASMKKLGFKAARK